MRPDDDEALTNAGYVTLTALTPPREDSDAKTTALVGELAEELDVIFGVDHPE